MLNTSPACSARQSSSRIVRTSTRAVSPSREISQDAGSTRQAPMRSNVVFELSMQVSERFRVFQLLLRTPAFRLPIVSLRSRPSQKQIGVKTMKRNALLAIGVGGLTAGV